MATYAFESVTVSGTAGGLTSATFDSAVRATITIEDADIRFRLDGTAPTALIGHYAKPGDIIELESPDELQRFSAIRTGGTSAVLRVTYSI